jgi:hypothetical protein
VNTLVDEYQEAGRYDVFWNGTNEKGGKTGSGVYFYRMNAGDYTSLKKMILMK